MQYTVQTAQEGASPSSIFVTQYRMDLDLLPSPLVSKNQQWFAVAPGVVLFSFFLAQTKMSWRSPLTSQYSR